eukprot:1680175-Pyramimonas_sp.AAC.1
MPQLGRTVSRVFRMSIQPRERFASASGREVSQLGRAVSGVSQSGWADWLGLQVPTHAEAIQADHTDTSNTFKGALSRSSKRRRRKVSIMFAIAIVAVSTAASITHRHCHH